MKSMSGFVNSWKHGIVFYYLCILVWHYLQFYISLPSLGKILWNFRVELMDYDRILKVAKTRKTKLDCHACRPLPLISETES